MKGMLCWVAAVAMVAAPAAQVQAQEETVFRASGNWTADYVRLRFAATKRS